MRTKNSLRNYLYAIVGQILNNILSFVCRTVFIHQLSIDYLGVGGLFSNILSLFSLAELGIGSAIIVYLYKPLAERDENKLKSLMKLYKTSYRIIGCAIIVLGFVLLPFLKYLVKNPPNVDHFLVIYLLFVINSSISYFFSYKRAIITADQKEYICSRNAYIFLFIQYLLQIVILYTTQNYLFYLGIAICCSFGSNIAISIKANKIYPFLKDKDIPKLDHEDRKNIFKNIIAMMSHKVGNVVITSTDNILISSFIGLLWVGLYSNYLMILNIINSFVIQLFGSMSASIGNINESENIEKVSDNFNISMFIGFWLIGFCSISFIILFNPFITMWIGNKFLLNQSVVLMIVINYYIVGIARIPRMYVDVTKLFWNTKYKPWAEAAINLSLALLLINRFGLIGVFFATTISVLAMSFWVDPYILFKHRFNKSLVGYFYNYASHSMIVIISGSLTYLLSSLSNLLIIKFMFCIIIPNLTFYLCYRKTREFKYLLNVVAILMKIKKIKYV